MVRLPRRRSSREPVAHAAAYDQFRLWNVPTSIWAYGFLRAVAFYVPLASDTGGLGLNLVVALALYIPLVRGSRLAWSVLLVLDILTLMLLFVTQSTTGAPWLVHICTAAAIITLLLPSTRAYIVRRSTARTQPT